MVGKKRIDAPAPEGDEGPRESGIDERASVLAEAEALRKRLEAGDGGAASGVQSVEVSVEGGLEVMASAREMAAAEGVTAEDAVREGQLADRLAVKLKEGRQGKWVTGSGTLKEVNPADRVWLEERLAELMVLPDLSKQPDLRRVRQDLQNAVPKIHPGMGSRREGFLISILASALAGALRRHLDQLREESRRRHPPKAKNRYLEDLSHGELVKYAVELDLPHSTFRREVKTGELVHAIRVHLTEKRLREPVFPPAEAMKEGGVKPILGS